MKIASTVFLKAHGKPWDVCAVVGCKHPTASGEKEKRVLQRRCKHHSDLVLQRLELARATRKCAPYSRPKAYRPCKAPIAWQATACLPFEGETRLFFGRCVSATRRFERIFCSTKRIPSRAVGSEREGGACIMCGTPSEGYMCEDCG